VGFGVNVGWAPPGAAKVADAFACSPPELLAAVLDAFDRLPDEIADAYVERLDTIGRHVAVHLPGDEIVRGVATGVDADGRLCLRDAVGNDRVFDVGDVVHLRRQA
jgi:BirA family biotin operon repressor/biotin-[acetyl-CoA-carboxylase] ligase